MMAGVGGREGRVEGREWKHAERALIGIDCCQLKQRDLREHWGTCGTWLNLI